MGGPATTGRSTRLSTRFALWASRPEALLDHPPHLGGDAQVEVRDVAPLGGHRVAHQLLGRQALGLLKLARRAGEIVHGEDELRQADVEGAQELV